MDYGEIYKLFVDGLGHVADNHVYKFKDYSEAIFESQIDSKEWLCQELKKVVVMDVKRISIIAGCYGLVSIPILYKHFGEINIDLYDVDEYTTDIGRHMFKDYSKVNIYTKDVVFDDIEYKGDVIINTSCEHMMDMKTITEQNKGKIFALQSNNNKNVKWLHINCAETSDELIEQSGLTEILFRGAIPIYGFKRIMVIGR